MSISGSSAFSIVQQPSALIAPGATSTFTVRFDASAAGTETAVVSIPNTDLSQTPFSFSISANVYAVVGDACISDADCNAGVGDTCLGGICGNFQFTLPQFGNIPNPFGTPSVVYGFDTKLYFPESFRVESTMDVTYRLFVEIDGERSQLTTSALQPDAIFHYRFAPPFTTGTYNFLVQTQSSTLPQFDNYEFQMGFMVLQS